MTSPTQKTQLYTRLEGGAIYTLEVDGQFLVLMNQAALYDLLDPTDLADMEPPAEKVWRFATSAERQKFLLRRFGEIASEDYCDESSF